MFYSVIDLQFRTPANRCGGTQSVHSVFAFLILVKESYEDHYSG